MTCTKCSEDKPFTKDFFPNNKLSKDGLEKRCKVCKADHFKTYRVANLEKINKYNQDYFSSNKSYFYNYKSERMKTDAAYRACFNARERARQFAKGYNLNSKSLGCSQEEFKSHIESQFQPGMSWDNYGKWHLDHKFPLSKAVLLGPIKFSEACHYKNLQPLWAIDNRRKSNK